MTKQATGRRAALAGATAAALSIIPPPSDARVVRIVIDVKTSPAFNGQQFPAGSGRVYETISGRAFGELDPRDPLNSLIQDIELGRDADGKVRYVASFFIVKPVDMSRASGLMWHDVPNRGGRNTIVVAERDFGDVGLSSGWQGDNSSATLLPPNAATAPAGLVFNNEWVKVPIARNADGTAVTGKVFGRIVNRSGAASQQIFIQSNLMPYPPATLDTTQAVLVSRTGESIDGEVFGETPIPSSDWAWGRCNSGAFGAFPGAFDATQPTSICLKNGFDPAKLYQVVYDVKDPYVLGVGFAAWRDVGSFFKNAAADDFGTANPLAAQLPSWSIARGNSQSGNYLRGWLHLGFNQDEAQRQVHDGLWPIIAGRRIALNFRWAQPDGVLELYQAGSEGPQWWHKFPDLARGGPPAGILDRCHASKTCPKVIEHFGAAEVWALKLTPEWVGTDPKNDIPLPENVRRYYISSTTHGGSNPANPFDAALPGVALPTTGPNCPGNNYGTGVFPANPLPHSHTVNALRVHFRNWVMNDVAPPPSRYPTLRGPKGERLLVDADKAEMGFPTLPQLAAWPTVPSNFINPVFDYDFGDDFNYTDATGVPTVVPPRIKQKIRMLVPRVDADGNELGGVPAVVRDVPLGTYMGWNVTAGGARPFHKDQICNYVGGMIPFAKTKQERQASGDPRPSLEERYGNKAGFVAAVRKAAANAVAQGFLLQADADLLISQAEASQVLAP